MIEKTEMKPCPICGGEPNAAPACNGTLDNRVWCDNRDCELYGIFIHVAAWQLLLRRSEAIADPVDELPTSLICDNCTAELEHEGVRVELCDRCQQAALDEGIEEGVLRSGVPQPETCEPGLCDVCALQQLSQINALGGSGSHPSWPTSCDCLEIQAEEERETINYEAPGFPMLCSFCGAAESFIVVGPRVCICVDCATRAVKGAECGGFQPERDSEPTDGVDAGLVCGDCAHWVDTAIRRCRFDGTCDEWRAFKAKTASESPTALQRARAEFDNYGPLLGSNVIGAMLDHMEGKP